LRGILGEPCMGYGNESRSCDAPYNRET
jgi:hypothetical protein